MDKTKPSPKHGVWWYLQCVFLFRGNNPVREAIHSVFLYHAIRQGLSMGIVNAGQLAVYDELPSELRDSVEDGSR